MLLRREAWRKRAPVKRGGNAGARNRQAAAARGDGRVGDVFAKVLLRRKDMDDQGTCRSCDDRCALYAAVTLRQDDGPEDNPRVLRKAAGRKGREGRHVVSLRGQEDLGGGREVSQTSGTIPRHLALVQGPQGGKLGDRVRGHDARCRRGDFAPLGVSRAQVRQAA